MDPIKLSDLAFHIKGAVKDAFPETYWVIAEISRIDIRANAHCYPELVEKDENNQLIAQFKANIWKGQLRAISQKFRDATNEDLKSGMKILALVSVEYHPVYSLKLTIKDIDPSYTIGEMARKKKEIIDRLKKEGIIDRNKALPLPIVLQSLAVISSESAAGWGDFKNHIDKNLYGYSFTLRLFPAVMQGKETEQSVVAALKRIAQNKDNYDGIIIIRGGGSTTDLDSFNNYAICSEIAHSPLPVLTGIGHERDDTVTDIVAHTKFKTPTAVANFLIDRARDFEVRLNEAAQIIFKCARQILNDENTRFYRCVRDIIAGAKHAVMNERHRVTLTSLNIVALSRKSLVKSSDTIRAAAQVLQTAVVKYTHNRERELSKIAAFLKYKPLQITDRGLNRISNYSTTIKTATCQFFLKQNNLIDKYAQAIMYLDPKNVLKRGYSITIADGKPVKDASTLSQNKIITSIFYKGSVKSQITEIKKEDDSGQ